MTASDEQTFQIGAVARLTGVPSTTIRMWERRYGVVEPKRGNSGARLYTQSDIHRLTLLRQLTDRGHAIGSIAHLDTQQLESRSELVDQAASTPLGEEQQPCRLLVYGTVLPVTLERLKLPGNIEITGSAQTLAELEATAAREDPEVLLLEYPSLTSESADEISHVVRRTRAPRPIVVYEFGSHDALQTLARRNIVALRAPISVQSLTAACLRRTAGTSTPHSAADVAEAIERRYNDRQLASLAARSTMVKCECPRHLTDLVFRLNAFETYSSECQNLNTEDAALHRFLHDKTAQARALLETALARLIEVEGWTLSSEAGQ